MGNLYFIALMAGCGAAGTLILTLALRPLAKKLGIMARRGSNGRRTHAVPLLGGAAVFLPVFGCLIYSTWSGRPDAALTGLGSSPLWIATWFAVFAVGLLDDWFRLPSLPKIAALFLLSLAGTANALHLPLDRSLIYQPTIALTQWGVLSLLSVAIMSGFRFIDGLDGLCIGIAFFSSLSLVFASALSQTGLPAPLLVLCGSSAVFFFFNRYPAKIFLGDSGSLSVGFLLATLTLSVVPHSAADSSQNAAKLHLLNQVALMAVFFLLPFADWALTGFRRIRLGRHLLRADWGHVHERLFQLGIPHRNCTFILLGLGAFQTAAMLMVYFSPVDRMALFSLLLLCPYSGFLWGLRTLETKLALQSANFGRMLLKNEPLNSASLEEWLADSNKESIPVTLAVFDCRATLVELSGREADQTAEFYHNLFASIRSCVRSDDIVHWAAPWELVIGFFDCRLENSPVAKRLESKVLEVYKKMGIFHTVGKLEGWRLLDGEKDRAIIQKMTKAHLMPKDEKSAA
jgi:UDP-GlcNAc:undecaprenyl-phosphate GlcNAc-1-phosphate transferase